MKSYFLNDRMEVTEYGNGTVEVHDFISGCGFQFTSKEFAEWKKEHHERLNCVPDQDIVKLDGRPAACPCQVKDLGD